MGKNIAAGVVGIIVAIALVWLVEKTGQLVYPPPTDLNFADDEAMGAYVATLPIGAFLFVAGAWFLGTLGGIVTACKIGNANSMIYAGVVGGLMLIATAANLIMIPHPLWFSILGVIGIIVAAWLGMKLGARPANNVE